MPVKAPPRDRTTTEKLPDRIEDLRAQAAAYREQISRHVSFPPKEREAARAQLAEIRTRYFRVLDEIDRRKRLTQALEKLLEPQFSRPVSVFDSPAARARLANHRLN